MLVLRYAHMYLVCTGFEMHRQRLILVRVNFRLADVQESNNVLVSRCDTPMGRCCKLLSPSSIVRYTRVTQ